MRLLLMSAVLLATLHGLPGQAQMLCNGKSCSADGTPYDVAVLQTQLAATPSFVANGAFISQEELRANYPCGPAPMLGKYARVSNMYQTVASVAICETDGSTYYWRPQRTDYATTISTVPGTINLIPFVTSPVLYISGTPTSNVTINPSTLNAWPGAQFRVYMPSTITLPYSINISSLVGNNTIVAVQGRAYTLTYTSVGWKSD